MNGAVCLLSYAAVLTWLCPPLLQRITGCGIAPRWGVAVWLSAIVSALLAWSAALASMVVAAARSLADGTAVGFCLEMLGVSDPAVVPGRAATAVAALCAVAVSALITHRIVVGFGRLRRRSGEHARTARIVGTPTDRPDVVIVAADRPAAYCVTGRPHAIVLTSAAVAVLDDPQLAAVLAHEDAHIRGRHHHLLMMLRAVAASLPRLPLFHVGADAASALLEMCADDAAVRRHGARPLVQSLISLAGARTPAAVAARLGAADTAVAARVTRLAWRASVARRWRHRVQLLATLAVTVSAPVLIGMLCHH
ncbi:hypothetical protein BEL07_24145 [Mycolicibacterium grossiae]|uniref:Peptidase M48 domain-containing protein n=1 Tax=Mycolicibacterium grossiae TaxID=1552759 RepID=A0A1E8PXX6_9MYCO|nr:M56 family metallopeptidase [Mycolicibacterium grossiae]OFJ51163.1 hypothetical protein BEL07_24145 [Mycolicibacterium grossiae]